MKKLATLPCLIMLCTMFTMAQDPDPAKPMRDIGFNTTFLLQGVFQSSQVPFSLMFKKYTADNRALRLGLDVYMNLNRVDAYSGSSNYNDASTANISLAIGKEYQVPIDKHWTWYYGGDITPFIILSTQKSYDRGDLYYSAENNSFGVGLRPLLGIRFNINPRLYLSAEANVMLQYARKRDYGKFESADSPYVDTSSNNIVFNMSPATGLFLYYRF